MDYRNPTMGQQMQAGQQSTADQQQREGVDLPSPAQLAQVAAAVGPAHDPGMAIRRAVGLYLRAVRFCREPRNDSEETLGLAVGVTTNMERFIETFRGRTVKWPEGLPKPKCFPATLRDFCHLIVKARTSADCTARLQDCLRDQYLRPPLWPVGKSYTAAEAEAQACARIEEIREADKQGGYFDQCQWAMLGAEYVAWWRKKRSEETRVSATRKYS